MILEDEVLDLLTEARKLQASIEADIKKAQGSKKSDLELLLKALKNDDGAYPRQMLVAQIAYLSYIVGGSDKKPGQEEIERLKELRVQLNEIKQKING